MRENKLLVLSENHFWAKTTKAARTKTAPYHINTNNNNTDNHSNIQYIDYG